MFLRKTFKWNQSKSADKENDNDSIPSPDQLTQNPAMEPTLESISSYIYKTIDPIVDVARQLGDGKYCIDT